MLRFRTFAACAAVGLAFCIAAPAEAASFNITDVIRADPADLNAALADATARNDKFGVQCYSGVIAYNAANPVQPLFSGGVGPVSDFQAARDAVKGFNAPGNLVPDELVLACGPLALDAMNDVNHTALSILGWHIF